MILQIFVVRKSLMISEPHSWSDQKIFQQARSAPGSEHRRLVRTPRRFIPSKQSMGQLRTQWRCQENSETASFRFKRPCIFEVFVFRISGANTPKRSCSNLGPTLEKAPTSRQQQISNASQEFPTALRGSTLVSRRSSSLCSLTPSALDQCVCVITFFELIFMVFEDTEH